MKKLTLFLIAILVVTLSVFTVNAKDTLYTINKYPYEYLDFLETSYNDKGQSDGFIVAGKFKETENESSNPYQGIVIKYSYEGKKVFEYFENHDYGTIDYLTYSYNAENEIDGYLIVTKKYLASTSESITNQQDENQSSKGVFIKLSLTGKKIFEKDLDITNYKTINKIIPIVENNQTEYLMSLTISNGEEEKASLLRYNKDLNIIFKIEPENTVNLSDVIYLKEEDKVSYLAIEEQNTTKDEKKLVKYEKDGSKEVLLEDLSKFASVNLETTTTGYVLYGITPDVKVEGGKYSYYLVNYDAKGNEVWESFGEIPIKEKSIIKLLPISKNKTETEYLLLYQNALDSSKEVIKLDNEGLYQEKVKKINNDYYNFKNFKSYNDTLYLIGHLTCPEEDNCPYKTNSLFLISDEDKVIEVKKENATSAFLIFLLIIPITILVLIYKKKIRHKEQNL